MFVPRAAPFTTRGLELALLAHEGVLGHLREFAHDLVGAITPALQADRRRFVVRDQHLREVRLVRHLFLEHAESDGGAHDPGAGCVKALHECDCVVMHRLRHFDAITSNDQIHRHLLLGVT